MTHSMMLVLGVIAGIPVGAMIHHYLMKRERREVEDLIERLRKAYHELREKLGEIDASI